MKQVMTALTGADEIIRKRRLLIQQINYLRTFRNTLAGLISDETIQETDLKIAQAERELECLI